MSQSPFSSTNLNTTFAVQGSFDGVQPLKRQRCKDSFAAPVSRAWPETTFISLTEPSVETAACNSTRPWTTARRAKCGYRRPTIRVGCRCSIPCLAESATRNEDKRNSSPNQELHPRSCYRHSAPSTRMPAEHKYGAFVAILRAGSWFASGHDHLYRSGAHSLPEPSLTLTNPRIFGGGNFGFGSDRSGIFRSSGPIPIAERVLCGESWSWKIRPQELSAGVG